MFVISFSDHPFGVITIKHDILSLVMHIPLTMTCQPVHIWLDSRKLCLMVVYEAVILQDCHACSKLATFSMLFIPVPGH